MVRSVFAKASPDRYALAEFILSTVEGLAMLARTTSGLWPICTHSSWIELMLISIMNMFHFSRTQINRRFKFHKVICTDCLICALFCSIFFSNANSVISRGIIGFNRVKISRGLKLPITLANWVGVIFS